MCIGMLRPSMRLFDDFDRTDATPARSQEGSFAFLNRIATPWWLEVRALLEEWFALYRGDASPEKEADLRARFRSPDARQHFGAWWELYMFVLLRSLNPDKCVRVEPERSGESTRPDFCVAADSGAPAELWVEAVTTFSGIVESGRHSGREAYVLDTINELQSPDFRLMITFQTVGETHPKKRAIIRPLRIWLNSLDRDDLLAAMQRGERRPRTILTPPGWEIVLEPMLKGTPGLHPNDRLIGIGPMSVGFVNDVPQARKAIAGKARRYARLEAPFVVAVMPTSPTFGVEDAMNVLYGSEAIQFNPEHLEDRGRLVRHRDGIWSKGEDRVSAVMFAPGVFPWTVAKAWPQLWLNPYAAQPIGSELGPLPRVDVTEEGHLESLSPDESPAQLFGLNFEWPGSGDPFDVDPASTVAPQES